LGADVLDVQMTIKRVPFHHFHEFQLVSAPVIRRWLRNSSAALALSALIVFWAAELSECILYGMPLPTSGGHVASGRRTVVFNGDLCDNPFTFERTFGDASEAAPNLTFTGRSPKIGHALCKDAIFAASQEWRSQQFIDRWLIFKWGDIGSKPQTDLHRPDECRKLSPVRHSIADAVLPAVFVSFLDQKPVVIHNEQVGSLQVRQCLLRYANLLFAGEVKTNCSDSQANGGESKDASKGSQPQSVARQSLFSFFLGMTIGGLLFGLWCYRYVPARRESGESFA
jgi:hypothetical protein